MGVDELYPGDPEADGFCAQHQCVYVCRITMGPVRCRYLGNQREVERSVWPGKGPWSSRQPKLTGLVNHVSLAHLQESKATGRSSRTTRQTGQGSFCIATAGCRNGTTGSKEKLLFKQPKGRRPQRSYETGRHLALWIWWFRARNGLS